MSPDIDPVNLIDRKSKLMLQRAMLWASFDEASPRERPALSDRILVLDDRLDAMGQAEKVTALDDVRAEYAGLVAVADLPAQATGTDQ